MLPTYPAIAVLSAEILELIQKKLNNERNRYIGNLLVWFAIILCAWWSLSIGLDNVFRNAGIIKMPL
jgi:hypothetical protein